MQQEGDKEKGTCCFLLNAPVPEILQKTQCHVISIWVEIILLNALHYSNQWRDLPFRRPILCWTSLSCEKTCRVVLVFTFVLSRSMAAHSFFFLWHMWEWRGTWHHSYHVREMLWHENGVTYQQWRTDISSNHVQVSPLLAAHWSPLAAYRLSLALAPSYL